MNSQDNPPRDEAEVPNPSPDPAAVDADQDPSDEAIANPKVSKVKAIVGGIVTVGVLVLIFVGIIPKFADYSDAWSAIQTMSIVGLAVLGATVVLNIFVYPTPQLAVTPGLGYGPAFISMWTRFTISNTIPGVGGALGLGVGYQALRSYSLSADASAASLAVISLWNSLVTLGLPVPAALLYVIFGGEGASRFLLAAAIGAVIVTVIVVLLVLVLRSQAFAEKLGAWCDRIVSWVLGIFKRPPFHGATKAVLDLRAQVSEQALARWQPLTWTSVAMQLTSFAVFWAALSGVGVHEVNGAEAFAAFALSRIAGFIPVTPGGLGTVDAALIGLLTNFGASSSDALAANLLWRLGTFFIPLFVGAASWLWWRFSRPSGTAKDSKTPETEPEPAA